MNTEHFALKELSCPCCGKQIYNMALMLVLEDVRNHFNAPVTVNSSTRCEKHNKEVGGADGSKHKLGQAADIVVKGYHPSNVYRFLENSSYSDLIGLGDYEKFTHVDVRGSRARW